MANLFVVLPTLAGNGSGAAVDVSGMGESKTVVVGSGGGVYTPTVLIEVALDAAGVNWSPLCAFQGKGERTVDVACHWMRATTSSFVDGAAPVVGVGANGDGVTFNTLVATAATGFGAGVDTSAMGLFKTVQITSPFKGVVNIQASEDGGVTYSTVMSFIGPGQLSRMFAADHMRIHRDGVPQVAAGLPVCSVAAGAPAAGGGSTSPSVTLLNGNVGALAIGQAVYSSANGTVDKAETNAAATSRAIGLVGQAAIAPGVAGVITTNGPLEATAVQWDAQTGDAGGLQVGKPYYVDPATPGKITRTAPIAAGQSVTEIGVAYSVTGMLIGVRSPISLG